MDQIRIGIVDDHAVVREGLRCILQSQSRMLIVAEAENGLAALEMVDQHRPDVILMDINMPVMDGLEATRIITAKHPQTKVVVLSMHTDDGIRVQAQEAGASHFLSKDCNPQAIADVIRNVHS